ncbi:riboflavin synthase [candidate division KSB1 bacterium]|nr:riboflavin synthase [candidate division KSB1 bacterium]
MTDKNMFTGLIEEIGTIRQVQRRSTSIRISIQANKILDDLKIDDSVAVNGACLTAVEVGPDYFSVDAVAETLAKTTLNDLRPSAPVNLERALRLQDRLGGHLVQGHIDTVARIQQFQQGNEGGDLRIEMPQELLKYVIPKGSITIDGISLTVAEITGHVIRLAIIPHTLKQTILQYKRRGDMVNIEVDLLAKYIEQLMLHAGSDTKITREWLMQQGF